MIQLEGPLTLAGTDYSDEIPVCTIVRRRNMTTKPATWGNARASQKAGSITESIRMTFLNDRVAAGVWAELWDAIDTDSGELAFVGRLTTAAVGADNPSFTATIVTPGVEVGGTAGQQNSQTWEFPVTDAGIVKAVA